VLSVDPGQSNDPTAIAVIDWQVSGADKWTFVRGSGRNLLYQDKQEGGERCSQTWAEGPSSDNVDGSF
jgi:hypothetical protein